MTRSKVNHDVRCADGAVLFLPPSPSVVNLKQPDVYAESVTALYPIGTLLWYPGMGKKYRYSKAGGALGGLKTLVINGNYVPDSSTYANDGGFYGHAQEDGVASAYDVGETVIYVTGTQDTPKNFYEGGHLIHFDAARAVCYEDSYVISGPDKASTSPWQNQKITLHKSLKYAIVAADGIEIWCNPYSNIKNHDASGYSRYATMMGVPPIPIQSGYYFWLQTSGPCLITPDGWGANCPGYAVDARRAHSNYGGGIIDVSTSESANDQIIGILLSATESTCGDAFIDMNLDIGH